MALSYVFELFLAKDFVKGIVKLKYPKNQLHSFRSERNEWG